MKNTHIKPRSKFFNPEFEDQKILPDLNSHFMITMQGAKVKNDKMDRIIAKFFGEMKDDDRKIIQDMRLR